MNTGKLVEIKRYDFSEKLFPKLETNYYAKNSWPLVYILSNEQIKEAYVGETADTYERMNNHLRSNSKSKLSVVHLISSEKFNKSATLDIESNLIKYISGDGQFKLLNGNVGLANHNYYQKAEVYWDIFKSIWNNLRSEGISKHSIDFIDNSDLFKYSPYKTLSFDQRIGLLAILKAIVNDNYKNILIEGGAGTGKTILAVFLFKLLKTNSEDVNFHEFAEGESEILQLLTEFKQKFPNPKIALVVPMASFRTTLKKVFKNIKGLNSNMVIGPAEIVKEKYDLVFVDESHRLRRRVNLGAYYGAFDIACEKLGLDKNTGNELDWILMQSIKAVFFYDENQSIKPSDVLEKDFISLKVNKLTKIEYLKSQFRVKGGGDYVKHIDKILAGNIDETNKRFDSKKYELLLFDSIEDFISQIKLRNDESGLSRLIAGYSWEWVSKNNPERHDIEIDGAKLKWNSVAIDWVNSKNSINEVGCIHTTQGYDLNYAGIIFGREISYDWKKKEIVIFKEKYFDKNGKQSINKVEDLKKYILNIYKTILLRGIKGTYIYACDPDFREYLGNYVIKHHSATSLIPIKKDFNESPENCTPFYDIKAAAGAFGEVANVLINGWVPLPTGYKASPDLFACRVTGESMNKIIPNGSVCLFRKYTGGSRNGKIVLVQHTSIQDPEFGSGYTVKEYHSKKQNLNNEWTHQSITLSPLSYNSGYNKIVLNEDDAIDLKVIGFFECVLGE